MDKSKHDLILNECLDFLKNNGVDTDEKMRRVIGFFFLLDRHVSFDDISHYVKKNGLKISDIIIRDVLELLVEYGFAIEKIFADNIVRYEHLHLGEHHDHFCCLKCGTIIEFFSPVIEAAQIEEARKYGFHAFTHKMQIHGLCDKCFGKNNAHSMPLAMVEVGGRFRVTDVGADESVCGFRGHLMDMGIAPGCEGEVIANHGGRIVIVCNGVRTAMGRGMSQKVRVTVID
ncbi:MAG TPA: transcriptional repressor [Chitinispirillaceae bacterium]|nr:transcriptional repressor [Chitinispirillaceae bacterium]